MGKRLNKGRSSTNHRFSTPLPRQLILLDQELTQEHQDVRREALFKQMLALLVMLETPVQLQEVWELTQPMALAE